MIAKKWKRSSAALMVPNGTIYFLPLKRLNTRTEGMRLDGVLICSGILPSLLFLYVGSDLNSLSEGVLLRGAKNLP